MPSTTGKPNSADSTPEPSGKPGCEVRARAPESQDLHPSTSDGDGRDSKGRFAKGNSAGKGNPHASRVAKLKTAYLEAVTAKDIRDVVLKLLELAKDGDVAAAREVCDRVFGKQVLAEIVTGGDGPAVLILPGNGTESDGE